MAAVWDAQGLEIACLSAQAKRCIYRCDCVHAFAFPCDWHNLRCVGEQICLWAQVYLHSSFWIEPAFWNVRHRTLALTTACRYCAHASHIGKPVKPVLLVQEANSFWHRHSRKQGQGCNNPRGSIQHYRNQLWAWTCLWSILPGTLMVFLVLMCASVQEDYVLWQSMADHHIGSWGKSVRHGSRGNVNDVNGQCTHAIQAVHTQSHT